ncbi:putative ribonuclease H-like domain-containing protein [Tanacetum coccineum]
MNQFCGMKGIKREFSVARTPQQNEVAERKNRTLTEATRTMLADSLLPITFWTEAVSTTCYVENRVLVTKPHNKTPYELLHDRLPSISFMRPFGCPVTILNTLDPLGKFDEKSSKDAVADDAGKKTNEDPVKEDDKSDKDVNGNSIYRMFTLVNAVRSSCDNLNGSIPVNAATLPNDNLPTDPFMPDLEDTGAGEWGGQRDDGIFHQPRKGQDEEAKDVDVHLYRSMIGSLMYLTAFRPDIMFATATVKTVDNGEQEITATVDGKEFTITEASVRRHLQLANVDCNFPLKPILNVVSSSHQKTQIPRQALNQVTELPQTSEPIPNVPDEAVYEEWDDRVERATTTAASLDAAHASGNITKTQSMAIPNVLLPQGIGAGGSPRCQEAMREGGSIDLTRFERVPTSPYDSLLLRVNTLGSDEGNDEEDLEDSSKQERMIEEIDQDVGVTLYWTVGGISTASRLFSNNLISVSIAGASMPVNVLLYVQEGNKDKVRRRRGLPECMKKLGSFNIEEWEDIQATIEADEELAQRIQAEEREKYSKAKKARLLAELINQRKRYFA